MTCPFFRLDSQFLFLVVVWVFIGFCMVLSVSFLSWAFPTLILSLSLSVAVENKIGGKTSPGKKADKTKNHIFI